MGGLRILLDDLRISRQNDSGGKPTQRLWDFGAVPLGGVPLEFRDGTWIEECPENALNNNWNKNHDFKALSAISLAEAATVFPGLSDNFTILTFDQHDSVNELLAKAPEHRASRILEMLFGEDRAEDTDFLGDYRLSIQLGLLVETVPGYELLGHYSRQVCKQVADLIFALDVEKLSDHGWPRIYSHNLLEWGIAPAVVDRVRLLTLTLQPASRARSDWLREIALDPISRLLGIAFTLLSRDIASFLSQTDEQRLQVVENAKADLFTLNSFTDPLMEPWYGFFELQQSPYISSAQEFLQYFKFPSELFPIVAQHVTERLYHFDAKHFVWFPCPVKRYSIESQPWNSCPAGCLGFFDASSCTEIALRDLNGFSYYADRFFERLVPEELVAIISQPEPRPLIKGLQSRPTWKQELDYQEALVKRTKLITRLELRARPSTVDNVSLAAW
jgi:hypothetical protein